MPRTLALLLLLLACDPFTDTSALRTCDVQDETVDCCTSAEQCFTYFGDAFPFCATPGDTTGRCVECTTDAHCDNDSYCVLDSPFGPYCGPLGDDR